MIGTIRKHSAWLWAIVITATIASFVTYFRPGRGGDGGGGGGSGSAGRIYKDNINSTDFVSAQHETELHYFFANGNWPDRAGRDTGFDTEQQTYFRLFEVRKVQDFHINIGMDQIGTEAHLRLQAITRTQNPSPEAFEKQVLQPHGLSMEDFERTVRHDLEINQLFKLVGTSGTLVTPQEAQMLYVRDNTEVSVQAVFFSQTNYLSQVSITPEAVSQFYSNRAAYYRLPDRVQVKYVEFPFTNYWAAAAQEIAKMTNYDTDYRVYLSQHNMTYFGGATNAVQSRLLFDAKFHEQQADLLAQRDANEFSTVLQASDTNRADYIEAVAAQKGYTVKTSEPFDSRNGPTDFSIPLQFTEAAFRLTPEEPFTSGIPGDKAMYVLALDKALPSELPTLEEIHPKVVAELTFFQSVIMARQATTRSFAIVTNALAAGKSFQAACEEAHVQPRLLPPFSLRTETNSPEIEAHVKFETLKEAAFTVLPGHANIVGTDEGALMVYVDERLPVNQTKMYSELPYFLTQLRQQREQEACNLWFTHEADVAMHDVLDRLQKRQGKSAQ